MMVIDFRALRCIRVNYGFPTRLLNAPYNGNGLAEEQGTHAHAHEHMHF